MDIYAGDETNYPTDVRYIEDGDAPTEANFFPSVEDLADRTAALKAGDLQITGDKHFTGETTFGTGSGGTTGGGTFNDKAWDINALFQFSKGFLLNGCMRLGPLSLADANATIAAASTNPSFRYVPRTLTGNRIYTLQDSLPIPDAGAVLIIARMSGPGTSPSAHTATFRRQNGSADLVRFDASLPAAALFVYGNFEGSAEWHCLLASPNVTFL